MVLASTFVAGHSQASSRGERRVPGRVLVKLRANSDAARTLASAGAKLIRTIPGLGIAVVQLRNPNSLATLQRSPAIEYAEPDVLVPPAEVVTPNDPYWNDQWSLPKTETDAAWSVTQGSASVKVAVLDSGIDAAQPDLAGKVLPGRNFLTGGTDTSDDYGHGTEVAGVIAARTDNGIGVAGYCPNCMLLPVKIAGSDGYASWSAMADGIRWAADQKARVISVSFAGTTGSSAVNAAIRYARRHGAMVVASAGNFSSSAPAYPAAYRGVVSVASSLNDDTQASYSNHGSWVSFAAPGCNYSTNRSTSSPEFSSFCGTSSAAPALAGIAALAFSYKPTASIAQVMRALVSGAVPVAFVSHGRVDARGTLAALGASV